MTTAGDSAAPRGKRRDLEQTSRGKAAPELKTPVGFYAAILQDTNKLAAIQRAEQGTGNVR